MAAEQLGFRRQRRCFVERRQRAPVHRRGLVGRRLDVVAERRGKGGLVAGGHLHGIDQRRPQVARADAQQLGEGAHLGCQLLGLAAGVIEGLATCLELGRRRPMRLFGFGSGAFGLLVCVQRGIHRIAELTGFHLVVRLRLQGLPALLERRQLGLEPARALALLLQVPDALAALGGELRQAGLGLVRRLLGGPELFARALQHRGGLLAHLDLSGLGLAQRGVFVAQAGEHRIDVVEDVLLAAQILADLLDARLDLGLAPLGLGHLAVETGLLGADPLQHRGAHHFLFAQGGQRLGDRVARPARLGCGAGALGQLPDGLVQLALFMACRLDRRGPGKIELCRFQTADGAGQLLVADGLAGLALEALELAVELADDVVDARQIGFGPAQLQLRLVAPHMQAGDAGGLLQNAAAGLGLGVDDLGNLALAHQRRRARAAGGVGEQNLHVAGAHFRAVDAVVRARLALDAARDLQRIGVVELGRRAAVGVVEGERHLGHVAGRPRGSAAEDDVVHGGGAHVAGRAFAHRPAQRLEQIRLAAAVGSDDAGETGLDQQLGRLHERLEARQSEPGEHHDRL
jgi:hypothetical protein